MGYKIQAAQLRQPSPRVHSQHPSQGRSIEDAGLQDAHAKDRRSLHEKRERLTRSISARTHQLKGKTLKLPDRDFDTGLETKAGEYALTDETYADLVAKLASHKFDQMSPDLQANILAFYHDPKPPQFAAKNHRKWETTLADLTLLQAAQPVPQAQTTGTP